MHDDSPQSRRGGRPDDSTDSPFDALGLNALFGDPTRENPVVDGPTAQPTYPATSAPAEPSAPAPSAPAFSWFDDEPQAPAANPFISAPLPVPAPPFDGAPVPPTSTTLPPSPSSQGATAFADTISSHPPAHLFPWRPAPQPSAEAQPVQQPTSVQQQPTVQPSSVQQQPTVQPTPVQQPPAQQVPMAEPLSSRQWTPSATPVWSQPPAQNWSQPLAQDVSQPSAQGWSQPDGQGRTRSTAPAWIPPIASEPAGKPMEPTEFGEPVADPRVALTLPSASAPTPESAPATPAEAAEDFWRRQTDASSMQPWENSGHVEHDSTARLDTVRREDERAASVFSGDVPAPRAWHDPEQDPEAAAWPTQPAVGSAAGFDDGPDPLTGGLGALFGGLSQDDDEPRHPIQETSADAEQSQERWMRPRWDQSRAEEEPVSFEVSTDFDLTEVRASGSLAGLARPAWMGEQPGTPDPFGAGQVQRDDAWQDESDQAERPAGPPPELPWLSSDTAAVAIASSARPSSFSWFGADGAADDAPDGAEHAGGSPFASGTTIREDDVQDARPTEEDRYQSAVEPDGFAPVAPASFIAVVPDPTPSSPVPFDPPRTEAAPLEPGQFEPSQFESSALDDRQFAASSLGAEPPVTQAFAAEPFASDPFAGEPLIAAPFIAEPSAAVPSAAEQLSGRPLAAAPVADEPVGQESTGYPGHVQGPEWPFASDPADDVTRAPAQDLHESDGDAWLKSATALLFGTDAVASEPAAADAPVTEPAIGVPFGGYADRADENPTFAQDAVETAPAWPLAAIDDVSEPPTPFAVDADAQTTAFERPWDPFGFAESDDVEAPEETDSFGATNAPTTPFVVAASATAAFGAAGAGTAEYGAGASAAASFGASAASASSQPLRARDLAAQEMSGSDAGFGGSSAVGGAGGGIGSGVAGGAGNGGSGGSGGGGRSGGGSGSNGAGGKGSGRGGSGRGGSGNGGFGRGGSGGGPGQFFNGILTWIRRNPRTSLIAAIVVGVVVLGALSFGIGAATSPASALGAAPSGSASATPTATATARPTPTAAAAASKIRTCSVDSYASASGFGTLEAQVVNATTGEVLYDRNGSNPAPTASVLKMLTAAAAYSILGPDYRVPTTVVKGSQPGQVVVIGGGDVTLTRLPTGQNSFYTNAPHLDDLANQVKQAWASDPSNAGQQITSLVVDTSLYSGPVWESSWDEHEERVVEGSTPYMTSFMVDGDRNDPTAVESPRSTDPVGRAANALADDLGGNISVSQGRAPAGAKQLGQVLSQPVSALAEQALTYSDNTIMEELARLVAIKAGTGNSFSAINAGTLKGLQAYGIDETGLYFADGSGLSANNKVPASYLTRFLVKVLNREGSLGSIYDGMPVAGKTGTLGPGYGRFDGSFSSAAVGSVNAKTGWIDTARTLAGVIHAKDGTNLTFAIYALNYPGDDAALSAIDNLTTAFYECGNNLSNN
ncbi:D-alanyl-D-alanine carboxypeptidase [Rathayibacter sp. CAU 1779]